MPREVKYYFLAKEFKSLPRAGGLLDQDPLLLEAFILCMNTEGDHARYKEAKEKQRQELENRKKNRKR
jgi:hypothetical protein